MGAKEKLVGFILIIAGAFPLVLYIPSIKASLLQYPFLAYVYAGEPLYQIIIILLGGLLIWNPRPKAGYPYPPHR